MSFFRHGSSKPYIRKASHAGSWYLDDEDALNANLSKFIHDAEIEKHQIQTEGIPRGIIAPHAGFSYSGITAAHAYLALKEALSSNKNLSVLLLHPSHHVYLNGCAISGASAIETPIGSIPIDEKLRSELMESGSFSLMNQNTDEAEHSGEMHYPFISKCFLDAVEMSSSSQIPPPSLRILPIMVGAITTSQEIDFGKKLAPFIARSHIFTVVSSDFCHWGKRFQYTPMPPKNTGGVDLPCEDGGSHEEIHEYIERLDRIGMDHISMQKPGAFASYIKEYRNTICGKAPISVYLNAIVTNRHSKVETVNLEFVKYAQSSQARSCHDSSVSYASAIARKVL